MSCFHVMFPYYDDCRSVAQDDVVEPHGKLWQGRLRGDGTYIHKQPKRRLLVSLCGRIGDDAGDYAEAYLGSAGSWTIIIITNMRMQETSPSEVSFHEVNSKHHNASEML